MRFGHDWSCASICPTAQPLLLVYVLKGGHILQANKNTVFNESLSFGLDFEGLCVDPSYIIPPGLLTMRTWLAYDCMPSSHRRFSSGIMCLLVLMISLEINLLGDRARSVYLRRGLSRGLMCLQDAH